LKKVKLFGIQLIILLLLLIFIEGVFFLLNKSRGVQQPLLINIKLLFQKDHRQLAGYGYRLIDPLLGWGLTDDAITEVGYKQVQNTVLIETEKDCELPLRIWITGGSTSDIVLNKENWPLLFLRLLEEKGYCAEIYVAATGGYSSGQELLKTIRDGISLNPDIHISYSGANEHVSPRYTSRQEQSFYYRAIDGKKPSALLPNTVFALNTFVFKGKDKLELLVESDFPPDRYWINNMNYMKALAIAGNYNFEGILQPLLGTSSYSQKEIESKHRLYVNKNQAIYPAMKSHADTTSYLHNLTAIFDTIHGMVYKDDCHIEAEYQKIVAKAIFDIIEKDISQQQIKK